MTQISLRISGRSIAARHSSKTSEHYTPPHIVEPARAVLGGIDLDPASCAKANAIVKATRYFTEADDGLEQEWSGLVFNNPPGGKDGNDSVQAAWWWKLASEWCAGRVAAAVFLGFSIEILQTTQSSRVDGLPLPAEMPHCFPAARVPYLREVAAEDALFTADQLGGAELAPAKSPPHASVLVLLPPHSPIARAEMMARFELHFAPVGVLCGPLRARW